MTFLTDFADQAVILPLAVAVASLLAVSRWWRGLLAWAIAVGGTLAVIGLGKFLLAACGPVWIGDVLQSPSGHTASATVVYGGVLGLAWRIYRPAQRHASLLAMLLISLVVGATRVGLRAHSWPEVAAGGLAGLVGAGVLLFLSGPPPANLRPLRLAAMMVIVASLMHGAHLRAEASIQDAGRRFAWLLPGCAGVAAQARP